jgi:undecaprenyl-diphosphatase
MTSLHAVFLGILQGIAEFLPISSSGHLIVVPWILGWPDHSLAFDVALHVGTLVAVVYAFAGDWWRLLGSAARGALRGAPFSEPEGRLLGLVALASVPGGLAGLLLEKWADQALRAPWLVATAMAVLGVVLFAADRAGVGKASASDVTLRDALLIGLAQAAAIVPGVSRSGATISMALFLGYRREESARFSFLLATPITFGAALVKMRHFMDSGDPRGLLLGMAAAAIFGLLSIKFLLEYVRTRDYRPFAYYRIVFAIVTWSVFLVRSRHLG